MEAMRIKIVLFFFASIFLFSCQKDHDRLALLTLQAACNDKWAEIENKSSRIEAATYKGGGRKADLHVLAESKRIANWKKSAIPELSVSGLQRYANSLISWNNNAKGILYNSLFFNQNDPAKFILRDIQNGRIKGLSKLETLADSIHYYQILYLLLRQEANFQETLSGKVTDDWSYNSSTSKLKYALNDTVKLITPFKIFGMNEGELLHYRVKSLRITHQDKPTNIVPSVEIIGKYVILKFIAQQKGTYIVNGIITGTYPESKKEELAHSINQHITVE